MQGLNTELEEIFKNKQFPKDIYYNVYKILEKEGENCSSNLNGVFVNLNNCKDSTVAEIHNYISNIEKNVQEHEIYLENTEKQLGDLKKIIVEKPKPGPREPKRRYNKLTKASKMVLDKELIKEKKVYKGVYKRIYNSMRGYKNKPTKKEVDTEVDVEADIDDDAEVDAGVDDDAEVETGVDDDLFGEMSDSDEEIEEIEEIEKS